MTKGIALALSFVWLSLFVPRTILASSTIGTFDISREFIAHEGTRAGELGFPYNPTLISMKVSRENIFAAPQFEISYRLSPQSQVQFVKGTGQIISQDSNSAVIRLPLLSSVNYGGACGSLDSKILYVFFRIGLNAEFANGHRLLAVSEQTNDSCHVSPKVEEITYTIEE